LDGIANKEVLAVKINRVAGIKRVRSFIVFSFAFISVNYGLRGFIYHAAHGTVAI
jgi:hypothetical protein